MVERERGFTLDSQVPDVNFSSMWHFLVNQPHLRDKAKGTDKQFGKGYRLYCAGHLQTVKYHPMSDESYFIYIKATILPSMRTSPYDTYISIRKSNHMIQSAYCTCITGLSGICCHVAALLYGLTEFSKTNQSRYQSISCPSRPQQWNIPSRKSKLPNVPIHKAVFKKHQADKKTRKISKHTHTDPRKAYLRGNNAERVHKLRYKLEMMRTSESWNALTADTLRNAWHKLKLNIPYEAVTEPRYYTMLRLTLKRKRWPP
ncbi:uncharacterized protein LOC144445394 [Glandiceps talaboti]